MTYSAINPIERHHLRRTWLLLDKINVESFGEIGLAFHAKRSLQHVRNVLEPIRKLRGRPDREASLDDRKELAAALSTTSRNAAISARW